MSRHKRLDAIRKSMRSGFTVFDNEPRKVLAYIHRIAAQAGFDKKYCVVGGMAVQLYLAKEDESIKKYLRPTSDIDIATLRDDKGISLYEHLFRHANDYRNRKNLYNLKIDGVWVNIDVGEATGIDGNYFREIIEDSYLIELPKGRGKKVRVISLEDLILTKLDGYVNGGREKDLEDIELLLGYCSGKINVEKMDEKVKKYFYDDKKFLEAYKYIKNELKV